MKVVQSVLIYAKRHIYKQRVTGLLQEDVCVYYSSLTDDVHFVATQETPAQQPDSQTSQETRTVEENPQSKRELNYYVTSV